ncbi:MAG: RNA polymerase subunit sigma-70 [Lachnospiraceae bacterium]|nr:RNA polymerase subunit sigma-70 [Lachnospiraceae bacterium]
MNEAVKCRIRKMREEGLGYNTISKVLKISENSIKSYCKRQGLGGVRAKRHQEGDVRECLNCGCAVKQTPGKKAKKFCSTVCRNIWWNSHLYMVKRKSMYSIECAYCKKIFMAYGIRNRKYCSHPCYIKDRFGEH